MALNEGRLLDDASREAMWKETLLADGERTWYALGWFSFTDDESRRVVGHEGGGQAWIRYLPDQKLAVIALCNLSGARADHLTAEIISALVEPSPVPD